jgi:transcriptional regulator with XRE-family HTH domain
MGQLHVAGQALVGGANAGGSRFVSERSILMDCPSTRICVPFTLLTVNSYSWMEPKKMSLVIGNQLRAARALIGVEQIEVAEAAGVHPNTVRAMEARGLKEITGSVTVLRKVQAAMERYGVEFTNGDFPGVKLASPAETIDADRRASKLSPRRPPREDGEGAIAAAAY